MADRGSKRPTPASVLEKVRQLKQQAQQQKYDASAWQYAVDDMLNLPWSSDAKAAFEEVLEVMPSAMSVWVKYIDSELAQGDLEAAKGLFGRCLLTCPCVDVFSAYLRFIKKNNEGRGTDGVVELSAAYNFALDFVGQDVGSAPLWRDYIDFLLAPRPGTEAFNVLFPGSLEGQEEAARTHIVRLAYQRAILVPSAEVERLWRDYEKWENKVDKQLGRKISDEWRPRYMAAKNVSHNRRRLVERLDLAALPLPPGKGGPQQAEQAKLWRQYLDFESSNPQRLEPSSVFLTSRIALAHGQCLMVMWFFPEMWFQYAHIQLLSQGFDAAKEVLDKGQSALPANTLLRFAEAELHESQPSIEAAQQVYDDMVALLEREIPPPVSNGADGQDNKDTATATATAELSPFGPEQGVLIWLQYIQFLRRTASAGVARQKISESSVFKKREQQHNRNGVLDVNLADALFLRARKWQQASIALAPLNPAAATDVRKADPPKANGGQLYAGMARLEWNLDHNNTAVPCRIFELGLDDPRLARDPAYIIAYSTFLQELGDIDNARAQFERVLSERDMSVHVPIWRAYAVMEATQGNTAAALQVEKRMRDALATAAEPGMLPPGADPPLHPAVASLQVALCKFSQEGLSPCEPEIIIHLKQAACLMPAGPVAGAAGGEERQERQERKRMHREWDSRDRDRERDMRDREPHYERDREPSFDAGPMKREEPVVEDLIEMLLRELPPPQDMEGPPVPPEAVMDVVMYVDMTPPIVAAVCEQLDIGVLPNGMVYGVAVPQIVPPPREEFWPPEDGRPPYHDERGGPPPPHDGYQHEYPHESYPPEHWGPQEFGGPYGPPPPHMGGGRKRRWEGPPDGRGPPPPFEYDGPPPPYSEHYGPAGERPPPHWEDRDRREPRPIRRERMQRE